LLPREPVGDVVSAAASMATVTPLREMSCWSFSVKAEGPGVRPRSRAEKISPSSPGQGRLKV
jgi:hypothetical protein